MKTFLFCIGTRPECIKLAPLILEAKKRNANVKVLVTGQHKEMLEPFLKLFNIVPDYLLNVLRPSQSLSDLTAAILIQAQPILDQEKPDYVFVQGDTVTAMACALAAFYTKISVVHVEAGLRTNERYSPFPEEMNRKLIASLASFHFAPTDQARQNLLNENIFENVFVTGNTGIDALRLVSEKIETSTEKEKLILVTSHRRENHGLNLENICDALLMLLAQHQDVRVIFPVHLNPNVQSIVKAKLASHPRIQLCEPQGYQEFATLMKKSYLILTDSGGIQEEAPYFKKPVFVLRDSTERPEGLAAGVSMLVGADTQRILSTLKRALEDSVFYTQFQKAVSPYGDGFAAQKILDQLA